jgi:uncharacterized metal-binding protein YceD (DUF177 family)
MNRGFPAGRIDLDALRSGPLTWSGDVAADPEIWDVPDLRLESDPRLSYQAEVGSGDRVRVHGRLDIELGLECRRCLRELVREVGIEFDYRFDPYPLREELILALPEYPECRAGCRGLCPMCGIDRNEMSCDCAREDADPRWNVLRGLVPDGQPRAAEPDRERDGEEG